MIRWSPTKLKFTLGIGTLASAALFSELWQKVIPAWLGVGIVILPLVIFIFADPEDVSHSIARFLQIGASIWYLVFNSILAAIFAAGGLKVGWIIVFVALAVGAIPCLVVLWRTVMPAATEKVERDDIALPLDTARETIDFSTPVVYRPKTAKTLLLLVLCAAFVAGGVLMIRDGQEIGWLPAIFFGLGVAVFTLQLLPNSSYLRVSSSGIEIRSLWRTHRYEWADISHFYVGTISHNKMVLIAFAPSYQRAQTARAVSKAFAGAEGGLPDTYGFAAEALAERLNQWKTAHARTATPPQF